MEATLVDYPIDDEEMWDKYQLGKIAGGDFKTNTLVEVKDVPSEIATHEDPNSVFGPPGNTIPALQRRGVVFMAVPANLSCRRSSSPL
jgi:hypothetical protein